MNITTYTSKQLLWLIRRLVQEKFDMIVSSDGDDRLLCELSSNPDIEISLDEAEVFQSVLDVRFTQHWPGCGDDMGCCAASYRYQALIEVEAAEAYFEEWKKKELASSN